MPPIPSPLRRLSHLLTICGLIFLFSNTALGAGYLAAEPMGDKKVRIDGVLNEWPGGFDKLKNKQGAASGSSVLVGYDKTHLYLAAKIVDSNLVRTKSGSKTEDHLTLEIYFPSPQGNGRTHQIAVYPGVPGKEAALVKVDGSAVKSAQAIEAPTDKGFTLECKIPWTAIPASQSIRVGMRGKVTYTDASSVGRVQSVSQIGTGSGKAMMPVAVNFVGDDQDVIPRANVS
jgi:hypothetical protein